jgi:hypothetical protein
MDFLDRKLVNSSVLRENFMTFHILCYNFLNSV